MTTVGRLEALAGGWEAAADRRFLFARAYALMTTAMLARVEGGGFADPPWVHRLLDRFADYYFVVADPAVSTPEHPCPLVWTTAFDACQDEAAMPLQQVLLGINAHINHDLPLALADVLDDWEGLAEEIRTNRHEDHEAVNDVIIASIDLVQGSVVNEVMPILGVLDTLLGRLDEAVFTATVRSWREHAWDEAQQLLRCSTDDERAAVVDQIHHRALRWAEWIRSL